MSSELDPFAVCQDLVRRHDPARYYAALFAPDATRRHLMALYAFDVEISRIREKVSEPLPGEVRLQWWADAVAGVSHGDVSANPVAAALLQTIEACGLPVATLNDLIDCRVHDLYDEPWDQAAQLIGYCAKTGAGPMILAAKICGIDENSFARQVAPLGVACALTGLLRALPAQARARRCFIPREILQRYGLSREDLYAGEFTGPIRDLYQELRQTIDGEAGARARSLARQHPRAMPALLPAALVPKYLAIMDRRDFDPFVTPLETSRLAMLWILWSAYRTIRR